MPSALTEASSILAARSSARPGRISPERRSTSEPRQFSRVMPSALAKVAAIPKKNPATADAMLLIIAD